jgi:hypothetical protein
VGIDSRRNNISLAQRGTCEWLFEKSAFRKWIERTDIESNNGVLWIKGHPGGGKSTLIKHALLHCQEKFKDLNIAFYFFNARGASLEKSPLGMLRSLVVQLLEQNPLLREKFVPGFLKKKRRHGESELGWETGELKELLLQQYEKRQHQDTLLLIDALDECNDSDVQEVVDFLENLSENAIRSDSNLRICLSSRHYPYIDMKKKIELIVEKQVEHDEDILKYVQSKLKVTDKDLQNHILVKAQHIFIWVVLVIELLNKEFNKGKIKAMQKKLDEIPSDLDKLFSNILEKEDSEDDKKITILIFQWMLFSLRPLKPTELYFAVLAGTDPDELGAWDPCLVDFETIERFITSASKGLVEIVSDPEDQYQYNEYGHGTDKDQNVMQFIHQSVIDFFTRNQRLLKLDPTLGPNTVAASHARLASCCIAYIMQEDLKSLAIVISSRAKTDEGGSDKGDLKKMKASYPLLEYCLDCHENSLLGILLHAEKAEAEGISQVSLLRRLEKYGNYQILQSLYDEFAMPNKHLRGARLLYAVSLNGCHNLARALILELEADVDAQGGYYATALQAAAFQGYRDIVELLLERRADANAQGGYYGTALQTAVFQNHQDITVLLLRHGAK